MSRNPFDWKNYDRQLDWSEFGRSQKHQENSSAVVAKKRMQGIDPGAIKGISDKGDSLVDDYQQQRLKGSRARARISGGNA